MAVGDILFDKVVPPGIEPGTQGFSVLCSTNWAMAPSLLLVCGCKDRRFLWFSQVFSHFSWKKCTSFRKLQYLCTRNSGFSAVGSALRSGRRGRWFESSNPDCKRKKVTILFSALLFFIGVFGVLCHCVVYGLRLCLWLATLKILVFIIGL